MKSLLFLIWSTVLILFSAWVTHVIVCIQTASYGFLIAGALAFPIAIVHGIGIWFGVWQ